MKDIHLIPLVEVKASIKKEKDAEPRRVHLGASEIGIECRADLFHSFRWSMKPEFDAETHLRFLDGHRSEGVMARYLIKSGVNLSVEHSKGVQHRFSFLGGHFAGSMDGLIRGGMPWHKKFNEGTVWEHKSVNDKKFKELIKLCEQDGSKALRKWDEVYYAQAQVYMLATGMQTHWLTCSTAGCRDFTAVLTTYDPDYAELMMNKAMTIIDSQTVPAKAFDKGDFFKAKFLRNYDILYRNKMPEVSFRNSFFSYPVTDEDRLDAAWFDDFISREVTQDEQLVVPAHHLWNPTFIPWAKCTGMEEGTEKPRWLVYQLDNGFTFYNCMKGMEGLNAYNSEELKHLCPVTIQDPMILEMRKHGAIIEAAK